MKDFIDVVKDNFSEKNGYMSYIFGKDGEYELAIEPLIFDDQMYLALYKNGQLLIEKIPIKPGK